MNFTLEITFPDGSRQKKELADLTEVTVGRDPACTVPLGEGSETASAKQLVLRVERNRVLVEDLGSSNGTFLKGQKITKAELRPGDEIGIGQKVLAGPRQPPAEERRQIRAVRMLESQPDFRVERDAHPPGADDSPPANVRTKRAGDR